MLTRVDQKVKIGGVLSQRWLVCILYVYTSKKVNHILMMSSVCCCFFHLGSPAGRGIRPSRSRRSRASSPSGESSASKRKLSSDHKGPGSPQTVVSERQQLALLRQQARDGWKIYLFLRWTIHSSVPLIDRLIGRLIDWLFDWLLVDWLVIVWLIDWLIERLIIWLYLKYCSACTMKLQSLILGFVQKRRLW